MITTNLFHKGCLLHPSDYYLTWVIPSQDLCSSIPREQMMMDSSVTRIGKIVHVSLDCPPSMVAEELARPLIQSIEIVSNIGHSSQTMLVLKQFQVSSLWNTRTERTCYLDRHQGDKAARNKSKPAANQYPWLPMLIFFFEQRVARLKSGLSFVRFYLSWHSPLIITSIAWFLINLHDCWRAKWIKT